MSMHTRLFLTEQEKARENFAIWREKSEDGVKCKL